MMKYIWINIKKKLPLYIICTHLFFATAFTFIVNTTFIEQHFYEEYFYYGNESTPGYILLFVLFMISMMILPLFGMNYRYSLGRSDLFRQAPYKNKHLRYGEHLSALAIIVTAFTLSYIFLVVGLMIKEHFIVKVPEANEFSYYVKLHYNYVYYIPAFFVFLVMGVAQYFISYFFVSRANNILNSIILLLAGELFLAFYILMPTLLFYHVANYYQSTLALPIVFVGDLFSSLIVHGTTNSIMMFNNKTNIYCSVQYIIALVTFAALAIIGLIAFLEEKDPSSEYAGKAKSDKPYQEIIYHAFAYVFGSLICGLNHGLIYLFISFFFFAASYYTFYGLLNRNFKLKIPQLITVLSIAFAVLLTDGASTIRYLITTKTDVLGLLIGL